jgi:hypothetical protein
MRSCPDAHRSELAPHRGHYQSAMARDHQRGVQPAVRLEHVCRRVHLRRHFGKHTERLAMGCECRIGSTRQELTAVRDVLHPSPSLHLPRRHRPPHRRSSSSKTRRRLPRDIKPAAEAGARRGSSWTDEDALGDYPLLLDAAQRAGTPPHGLCLWPAARPGHTVVHGEERVEESSVAASPLRVTTHRSISHRDGDDRRGPVYRLGSLGWLLRRLPLYAQTRLQPVLCGFPIDPIPHLLPTSDR